MLKLGNLIQQDVFILENSHLGEFETWKNNYEHHLINNQFKACKIGLPISTPNETKNQILKFIESLFIKVELFHYHRLTAQLTLFDLLKLDNHNEVDKTIHVFPDFDVTYKTIGSELWDLAVKGYEVIFYKAERMKECQKNTSTLKRYSNKGVILGFSGSNKYPLGILHKRKIQKLMNDGIVDFWVTATCNPKDSLYLSEIKLKTELLTAKMRKN